MTLYFCNWRSATNLYPILSLRSFIPTCIVSVIPTARELDQRSLAGSSAVCLSLPCQADQVFETMSVPGRSHESTHVQSGLLLTIAGALMSSQTVAVSSVPDISYGLLSFNKR